MTVQSPCIDICKLDGTTGLCIGCLRTRDEIREWKNAADERRLEIIGEAAARREKLTPGALPQQTTQNT
ncbi:putative Fe-S protein YdhL (DUF1289 family) [Paraburkholderia sp. GAS199]|uniref:DUF1289 domain-containing protein n=1 Tax=Paraburkholderia sp. GAS199 TaxID=3035126 RepID=UPI003D192C44